MAAPVSGQSPSSGTLAGAPDSRLRVSFFHAVTCRTSSQIVWPFGTGRDACLLSSDALEDAHERRAVPRIAVMLALELINEAIDFRFSNSAVLRGHDIFFLMRAGPHPRALYALRATAFGLAASS